MSRSIVNKPVNCQKMYYGSVCVLAEMVTLRPCGYTCPLTVAAWRSASPLAPCGSEKSNLSTLISERLFNLLSTIVQPQWYHAALSCLQYTFCSYGRCSFYVSIRGSWGQLWNRWTTVSFSSGVFASDLVKATVMCHGMLLLTNRRTVIRETFHCKNFRTQSITNNAELRLRVSNTSYFAWSWLTFRNCRAFHAPIYFLAWTTKQLMLSLTSSD